MTCVRRAWLTLGNDSIELEDVEGGWACVNLDLGWPEIREVTNNRPDQDGIYDQTRYFGARAIAADIKTTAQAKRPDEVASQFGRFMYPGTRSQLHYILDRGDNAEHVLMVRPSGYQWPIAGGRSRDISLSWIAADPLARSAVTHEAISFAGSSTPGGRLYNWQPNRYYIGSGGAPSTAYPVNSGDVPVAPLLRIYGPITEPQVHVDASDQGVYIANWQIVFETGFIIDAGAYVEVDCRNHTATLNGDPAHSLVTAIQWSLTSWPLLYPVPAANRVSLHGETTNGLTQVQIFWRDGFLT